ncbi:MAG: peptide chain release factor N(5)-glutamine methyltransferase [Myxococcota bacterium]
MSESTTPTVWTIAALVRWTQDYFAKHGIDSPRLDAELLLADVLGKDRVYLYTHHDQPLDADERAAFRERVKRRAAHEPVAYILGHREFFGAELEVTPDVLIPRPETEHVVEAALAWAHEHDLSTPRILDLGTGSGAIIIALGLALRQATLVAVDRSAAALDVMRRNLARHGLDERCTVHEGDLFAPVAGEVFDLIVSNPPYVEDGARGSLAADVREFEPADALFAGADGLDIVRRIIADAPTYLARPGLLAVEIGSTQAAAVRALAEGSGCYGAITFVRDLQGHERVLCAPTQRS